MLEWPRRRARIAKSSIAVAVLGGTVLVASALAHNECRATITGDPIVGHVLTANLPQSGEPTPTATVSTRDDAGDDDQPLFKWQGCDPAVANCTGAPDDEEAGSPRISSRHDEESPWVDLPDLSPTATPYTVQQTDLGHLIRVLVKTEGHHDRDHLKASDPVGPVTEEVKVAPPPLEPEHGISFLAQPAAGTVTIKEPGASGFTPLTREEKIAMGSVVDTRGGTVEVTAAVGDLGETTEDNSVDLWGGLIRIEQAGDTNAAATAKLVEKLRCARKRVAEARVRKSSGPVATKSRKRRRHVWGSGHGNYKTSGSGGTGSVRGTTWLTKDTCRGTFFKVTDGIGISVFDFDLGQTFDLGPGQSYFARNR